MAQVQLDNYSGHEETSQDSLTEVDESRPPDPSLILSMETRATDPSLNISSPRAPECLSPAQDQTRATDPSLDISSPRAPEEEDDEEENSIPQHEFDVKKTQGKLGKMKGVAREKVSLMIGNHIFRRRRQLKNGSVIFTCNGCEAMAPKTYLSAIARIIEDGTYELVEWPRLKDHRCWADGSQAHHRKALDEMLSKVTQDPTRSAQSVYEEVRNSFTQNMEAS